VLGKKLRLGRKVLFLTGIMMAYGGMGLFCLVCLEEFLKGETFSRSGMSDRNPIGVGQKVPGSPLVHAPRRDVLATGQGSTSEGRIKVLGAATAEQASQIGRELESVWERAAQLADRWTQAHRQPHFPARSLTVVIGQSRSHETPILPTGRACGEGSSGGLIWILDQHPPTWLMATGSGRPDAQETLGELKRQMLLAFFNLLPNGQKTPLWVRWGLAEYLAEPPGSSAWPSRMPPLAPLRQDIPWGQAAPEHLEISPQTYTSAGQWIRYLLEGQDAQYAPKFVEAMSSADPRGQIERVLEQIAAASGPSGQWKAQFGLPIVRKFPPSMSLGETERKMVFLLKLTWRFRTHAGVRPLQPRIIEHGQDRSLQIAWTGEKSPRNELQELQERIGDSARARWATLDWEGRLLFSDDLSRWQTYFQQFQAQCRVVQQEGKRLLQFHHPAGGVLEGWLEDNPEDPGRPIACLRRVNS